jgi:hypothetical protein
MRALLIRKRLLVAALCFAPLSAPAYAQSDEDYINPDRPGIADGSTTVGAGHIQIETAFQREFRDNEAENSRTTFVPTLLRLGVSEDWELRVEGNTFTWKRDYGPDSSRDNSHDFAPTSLGLKYNFLKGSDEQHPSLGAIVRVFPASGSGDEHTSHVTGDFRLAADWQFAEKWSLNPNVGVGRYEDDSGRPFIAGLFATTLNFNPSKIVNLFIDTGMQFPESKGGRSSVIVDAGAAYIIGHDIQLDVSVGTGIAGSTPPHPFVAAGFSKRF